jgi:hypothetical protein
MTGLFRTTVVEISGVRTISGGGTNASNAGQALLNLGGVSLTGDQTISGSKTFAASSYLFSGANVIFVNNTGISSGRWDFTTVTESFSILNITNQTINFPLNSGMNFILPLTTGITGITFSNTPTNTYSFTLRVDYSGAHSIVWPTGTPSKILWPSSTAPTLTSVSGKKDFFTFLTYNNGDEFFGFNSSQNF